MKLFPLFKHFLSLSISIGFCVLLISCGSSGPMEGDAQAEHGESFYSEPDDLSSLGLPEDEKLRVVATTNIVADVVSNIGGQFLELKTLMPANTDPHSFEPTPADLRAVSEAHVVFINGLGLEEFLEEMIQNTGGSMPVVSLSEGIQALVLGEDSEQIDPSHEASQEGHTEEGFDPHVWFDPTNTLYWIDRVVATLSALDPERTSIYHADGQKYKNEIRALDDWIVEMVSKVAEEDRLMVTDHKVFEYLAVRYGFEVVGAVIPVFSSAADPSAREIAELEDRIRDLDVKVIFIGESVNPSIVEAVAQDTGIEMVQLYTGSLSDKDGPASTYIDFMHYNVEAVVKALLE